MRNTSSALYFYELQLNFIPFPHQCQQFQSKQCFFFTLCLSCLLILFSHIKHFPAPALLFSLSVAVDSDLMYFNSSTLFISIPCSHTHTHARTHVFYLAEPSFLSFPGQTSTCSISSNVTDSSLTPTVNLPFNPAGLTRGGSPCDAHAGRRLDVKQCICKNLCAAKQPIVHRHGSTVGGALFCYCFDRDDKASLGHGDASS